MKTMSNTNTDPKHSNNQSQEQAKQKRAAQHSRYKNQCQTFPHLGATESMTYNWVKGSTECNSSVPSPIMADRLKEVPPTLLELVAESPTVSAKTLETLAFNSAFTVRQAVADSPKTPDKTLLMLAHDQCPEVRFALAENHNMPLEILHILSEDENPYVRVRAEATIAKKEGHNKEV